ncbi:alpha/beta fold hydrolase [Serinicoccus kebangsaanensis]|uniref:alpha/beta fold hydrolase n=1 Tax=Serinicoccus kebangsaanensis TaxID=2602069 RepID=UPI00124C7BD2|nr:alpha/beta fold hydrolase [Serinicoccus kebangsaanensis]
MTTQIVLVPGFWLGEWAWEAVARSLSGQGYAVDALTLPGQGVEDPNRAVVTPQDQADSIVAALDPAADRRVLAVHSGAAIPGTLVIDQRPELVDHMVWVDTAPSADGAAMDADFAGEVLLLEDRYEDELAEGAMRDLTEDQLATFRSRAVPTPGRVVSTPVRLTNDARHDVPATVICSSFPSEDFRSYAEQGVPFLRALPDYRALGYVDLPTGHWPMWSRPEDLAQVLAAAAG